MEDEENDDLVASKLKECNKNWDKKKKDGLEILRKRLNNIVNDDDLHASARLQKLYESTEITQFMHQLLT